MWSKTEFTALPPTPTKPVPTAAEIEALVPGWSNELRQIMQQHGCAGENAFRIWVEPKLKEMNYKVRPAPRHLVDQAVVMIDSRQNDMILFSIKHSMYMLGPGWALVIFHTDANYDWLVEQLEVWPGGAGENTILIRVAEASAHVISAMMLSHEFYDLIDCETIITIQQDGMILRSPYLPGPSTDRIAFDKLLASNAFLGAPWACPPSDKRPFCEYGGNGGFSMRKSSVMKQIASHLQCEHEDCRIENGFLKYDKHTNEGDHEDGYIQKALYRHRTMFGSRIPTPATAMEWSWESRLPESRSPDPFMTHAMWVYYGEHEWIKLIARARQYYL